MKVREITLASRVVELVELYGSLRKAAEYLDVDAGYLSRLCAGSKNSPGEELLDRMGLEKHVHFTRKEKK